MPLVLSRRRLLTLLGSAGIATIAACSTRDDNSPLPPPAQPTVAPKTEPPVSAVGGPASAPAVVSAPPVLIVDTPVPSPTDLPLLNGIAPEATATTLIVPAASPTALPPTPVPPTATATPIAYVAERLKDRLGSAQTSYAGSIPERAWNVELATKRLDGTKVPPGGIFSFNKAVGATTISAGFKIGYGITLNDDKPETVPSVAGGICQVATTVFQAAFWAGLPLVERHYHLYWIPRYGQPPSGRVGFDATVDDPGVDLKFKNTTDDWIRLNSWYDGQNVGFVIRGVDPGWDVEASKPKVFDPIKTSQEVVKQDDPTMPHGRELSVEHAEDGFKVTVTRLVKYKGEVVDEYTFTNNYRPSRNVILVGTKGAPAVTGTPAAAGTGTPAAGTPGANGTPKPAGTPGAAGTATAVADDDPDPTPKPKPAQPTATAVPARPSPTPLPPGQVRVPSLVGMSEAQARHTIDQAGLSNTYTNYQGPGDVPSSVLNSVQVGAVLSQSPPPGSGAAPGSVVYIAVRKA